MKQCIFFDLDGTLWDALIPLTESWNQAMVKADKPYRFTLEKTKSYMGLTPEETVPLAFPDVPFEEGLKLFKTALVSEIGYLSEHPGKTYPQEDEVLEKLSEKYLLTIVSNSDKGYVENYLKACHKEKYFADHVCAGDTSLPKWKNILYLKEKMKADQVIYIGDTLKDKTESLKAHVLFIHAAYGFGEIENDEHYIKSLEELPPLAEKLFSNHK
jgi:phosphoglycolate phosphatase